MPTVLSRIRQAMALPERETGDRPLLVSLCTLLLGAAVVWYLTEYNFAHSVGDEYLLVNLTGLLFLPFLLIFGLFKEEARTFGFGPVRNGGMRVALLMLLFMVPFLVVASRQPAFQAYYPMRPAAAYAWQWFLYHELTYGLYMFGWEFFFRGFLTFGLSKRLGWIAAIALQTIAFGIMHYGKPMPEFIGSFVAAVALGWLAVRSRSFVPCFAVHWAVTILFDVLAIHGKPGGIF